MGIVIILVICTGSSTTTEPKPMYKGGSPAERKVARSAGGS